MSHVSFGKENSYSDLFSVESIDCVIDISNRKSRANMPLPRKRLHGKLCGRLGTYSFIGQHSLWEKIRNLECTPKEFIKIFIIFMWTYLLLLEEDGKRSKSGIFNLHLRKMDNAL